MKSKLFEIISIFVFIVNHIECYSYDWPRLKSALNCTDLNPQRIFSVPDVLGTWYGYETFANQNNEGDEVFVNPCVVIQLSDISYGVSVYSISKNVCASRKMLLKQQNALSHKKLPVFMRKFYIRTLIITNN